jgi:hypothetical protein
MMDLRPFEAITAESLLMQAQVLLSGLGLAQKLRGLGSEVAGAVLDLAVLYPPVSIVAFDGVLGLVVGYEPSLDAPPKLNVGVPGVGVQVVPADSVALVAHWGDLTPARVAQAYADEGPGIQTVIVSKQTPFHVVEVVEA